MKLFSCIPSHNQLVLIEMSTIKPTIEAKIARIIYQNLTPIVVKASTNPLLCKLNLHNNSFLKKVNYKAKMIYGMEYQPDILVKASYDMGSEDNIENALLSIHELIRGDYHAGHKEYIFKRIEFLISEAITNLYERNHQEWLNKIGKAIQEARSSKKITKKQAKKPTKSTVKKNLKKDIKPSIKSKSVKKKVIVRKRNKLGQFICNRRKR